VTLVGADISGRVPKQLFSTNKSSPLKQVVMVGRSFPTFLPENIDVLKDDSSFSPIILNACFIFLKYCRKI
jgi:hypothetical protein